jgi:8-amino-7-oxononanoate synthase
MSALDRHLEQRLSALREQKLSRSLRQIDSAQGTRVQLGGRWLLNFSSNDYLGLANDDRVRAAAIEAINRFGAGSGASRLICGSLEPHHELEESLARYKHAEAALTFSSGYATALGTICALLSKEDTIVLDKLVHACMVDAARLSGARIRVFGHNDLNELEDHLRWADGQVQVNSPAKTRPHTLVVTESVFSMDGDLAPLAHLVELKEKYGAWLMVDEAHSTGLYGPKGAGVAAQLGLKNRIEIQMGTLGKAMGASGGYICGSRVLIDYLVNRARSFIFSTAPVPASSAAARAAIGIACSSEGDERREALWQRAAEISQLLLSAPSELRPRSAILPIVIGDEAKTMAAAASLLERGFFVPGIRHPSVPRCQARLRLTATAAHTAGDVRALAGALKGMDLASSGAMKPEVPI